MLFFRKSKFVLLVLLFVVTKSIGQQYPSKNYSTLDGLPNNSIYSVFKDSRGILWIGTANGVSALINGKITNFSQKDGLAYNNCWSIVEDNHHHLWFASYGGGITFYDGKKFKIINERKGLVNNYVRKLFTYNDKF
jgi:ligand-binding sensor domain-containing protein